MPDELIDILNQKGKLTGKTISRNLAHKTGVLHASSHVWIYNPEGQVLLQIRSKKLYVFPGLLDISVAGHVPAGESPIEAAVREVFEEIGLEVSRDNLKLITIVKAIHKMPNKPEFYSREFNYVYLLRLNNILSDLRLQKSEVHSLRFVPIDQFENEVLDPVASKKYVPHSYYPLIIEAIRKEL